MAKKQSIVESVVEEVRYLVTNVKRHIMLVLTEVIQGSSNGDPQNESMPRIWPDGRIENSNVSTKAKIRKHFRESLGMPTYITPGAVLNLTHKDIYRSIGVPVDVPGRRPTPAEGRAAALELAKRFPDVRMFGAVSSTGDWPIPPITGPIQVTWSLSENRPLWEVASITRSCVASEEEAEEQNGGNRTFGRVSLIRYALFRNAVFVSPELARKTDLTEEDVNLFCRAMKYMYTGADQAAGRGIMTVRKIFDFQIEAGSAVMCQAQDLLSRVHVELKSGITEPLKWEDYTVTVDQDLPKGVVLIER